MYHLLVSYTLQVVSCRIVYVNDHVTFCYRNTSLCCSLCTVVFVLILEDSIAWKVYYSDVSTAHVTENDSAREHKEIIN